MSSCHSSLVQWLEGNAVSHPGFTVIFGSQSKLTLADEHNGGTASRIEHSLAIMCTTGSNYPTAFSEAVIQKNCIYCFGNHCFQFLLGFRLFSDKAIIELMAEEFIRWPSSLLGKGRHLSHLVGTQQPEVGRLRGCGSLNQSELLGTAIPANFLGN